MPGAASGMPGTQGGQRQGSSSGAADGAEGQRAVGEGGVGTPIPPKPGMETSPSELEVLDPQDSSSASSSGDMQATPAGGAAGSSDASDATSASATASAGGAAGGAEPGGVTVSVVDGGGDPGLDAELMETLEIFEGDMQRTITILASANSSNVAGGDGDGEGWEGDDDAANSGEGQLDQMGAKPQLILVEGDLSVLEGDGAAPAPDGSPTSGVVTSGEGGMPETSGRQGDSDSARILVQRIPEDVGDGADDDVVARQIREAAINESDPVLREKLWEEYRNYKKSI